MITIAARGHHNVIYESAPVHATVLAQPAAGADALKDLRARCMNLIRPPTHYYARTMSVSHSHA